MTRYFFHVRNQTSFTRDEVGGMFADVAAARDHAADAAGQIVTGELRDGNAAPELAIEVEDVGGRRVLTVSLRATVAP